MRARAAAPALVPVKKKKRRLGKGSKTKKAKNSQVKKKKSDDDSDYDPDKTELPVTKPKVKKPVGRPRKFPGLFKDDDGIYHCSGCPETFKSTLRAHSHYEMNHHNPTHLSCESCPMKFEF